MLVIDKMSRKPIYEQLVEGLTREIVTGLIGEGEQLPSIRELSVTLGVNPNTVQKALLELDRLGVVVSSPGRGVFVAERAVETIRERMTHRLVEVVEIASELARAGVDRAAVIAAIERAYDSVESRKGEKEV